MDVELLKLLESSVPPIDLTSVSAYRMALAKFSKQAWP